MTTSARTLRVGTRGSELALVQARSVIAALVAAYPKVRCEEVIISTRGDRLVDRSFAEAGSRGIFALDLETTLREGAIDLAVHSLKDLASTPPEALVLGAILPRADPRDALVSRDGRAFAELTEAASIATSSVRRSALLRCRRPDIVVKPIRGNVPTRLRKARELGYDGVILAAAGLDRLGLSAAISERLDPDWFLPEAGQGAIAVQVREDDSTARTLVAALDDASSAACCLAERSCVASLGGDCDTPIAALAQVQDGWIGLTALVCTTDGQTMLRRTARGPLNAPAQLGKHVAAELLDAGAASLIGQR